MDIWFVDDREENRATWLASFPESVHDVCALRVFESVPELLTSLDAGDRPDIVFVDFFISGHYGLEVIDCLLDADLPPPLIVAHSSMDRANEGMLRAGAHLAMAKEKGVTVTKSIQNAIRGPRDLQRLVEEYAPHPR